MKSLAVAPTTKQLIQQILAQPTAPFREHFVRRELIEILNRFQIPHFQDRVGNLIAGVKSMRLLRRNFHIAMFAHTDHPGFHLGPHIHARRWKAQWFGGANLDMLGSPVRVYHRDHSTQSYGAKITKLLDQDVYKNGFEFEIEFKKEADLERLKALPHGSFGTFDFPGYKFAGGILHSRAADDLVGCAMSIGALIDQEFKRRPNEKGERRLIGIFTRAEEVGFVGCVDLLRNPKFPKQMHVISLEASRTLPEAELGKGCVLRIGDARTLCHSGFSNELWRVAKDLQAHSNRQALSQLHFQRRLMSGGMCELTALAAYGHIATALAVPLGNYHNWPGPQPEHVALRDVDGGRRILGALGDKMHKPVDWQKQTKKDVTSFHRKLKKHLAFDLD